MFKEEIAREHFRAAERDGRFGVVMVGIAQERTSAWRGWRDGGPDGHPHFEYRRQSISPNNYYFYIRDPDWGPAACEDPAALAAICARLHAADVQAFFDRWEGSLPSPLGAQDGARSYRHELAFRQAEISDTRMFDRPAAGQAWFERTLPDQPTLGRPDQVAIVFDRRVNRRTPGRFHTKIFIQGVEPAIQVHYRASKVKQYFKENRALRTQTTVNDTRDFGIGRRLTDGNWQALVSIGTGSTSASRTVNPSLAELERRRPPYIADRAPLAKTWRALERALDGQIEEAAITTWK